METLEYGTKLNVEVRKQNDLETWLAECIDGVMRTPFEYEYDAVNDKLYAEDGSDMDEVFDVAIETAKEKAEENPNAAFLLRRTLIESDERDEMKAMMRGDLGETNTMVICSDFPPELMDYPVDYEGFNVTRKQTMERVLIKQGNKLKMYTQSLDGSNRQALEETYRFMGREPQEGELLGQRMHETLDEEQQETLIDALQHVYDQSMQEQTGVPHQAGIPIESGQRLVNTYDFVREQKDLVGLALGEALTDTFSDEKLYQTIAALQYRYDQHMRGEVVPSISVVDIKHATPATIAMHAAQLQQERTYAGTVAASQGKKYSGCGYTVTADDVSVDIGQKLESAGYTLKNDLSSDKDEGASKSKETWSYDKEAYCRECQPNPDPDEPKKMCGPCDICEDCVNSVYGGKE